MADATVRFNIRQFVFTTPETLRHSFYSTGVSAVPVDTPPNWFGKHSDQLTSSELDGNWRTTAGPRFNEPFLRADLVTGSFAVRPPQMHHIRTLNRLTVEDGTGGDPARFVPGWEYLPGVERRDLATGGVVLDDEPIFNRRGEAISWVHLTALQSFDRDWGNKQRLWRSAPRLDWLLRGSLVRLPRLDNRSLTGLSLTSESWTSNPAALRAWLLTHRRGVPLSAIDLTSLSRAIQICNQTYTVFIGNPEGLREETNPHEEDQAEWFYNRNAARTVELPGATADTKITAVAQDPLFHNRVVLVSSSDRKFWVLEDGEFVAHDFPTVATRDAVAGEEIYPAGGASITHDGALVVGMRAATGRTANASAKDGYDYQGTNAWHIYFRRLREPTTNVLRNAETPVAIGSENMSRRATNVRLDFIYATTAAEAGAVFPNVYDSDDYNVQGSWPRPNYVVVRAWWNDSSRNDVWLWLNASNHTINRLGWIEGSTTANDDPSLVQFNIVGRLSHNVYSDGSATFVAEPRLSELVFTVLVPYTAPDEGPDPGQTGTTGVVRLNSSATYPSGLTGVGRGLDVALDVWPSDFLPTAGRWSGMYVSANRRHLEYVRREVDSNGNVQIDVLQRTLRLLDFDYRTAAEGTPSVAAEDGRNRLTTVWWERPQADGGEVPLAFLRPRRWDDIDSIQLTAPQARVWRGNVYVAREDLPPNYWAMPPESPVSDAVAYQTGADGQLVRDGEGNPIRAANSGNWERESGTRHVFAPDGLTNADIRQLRLFSRRYDAHGEVSSGGALLEVERQLDRAMLGHTVLAGGKYFFTAGRNEMWHEYGVEANEPITSITDEDLTGDTGILSIRIAPPREERVTQVTCELLQDETEEWTPQAVVVADVWAALRHGEVLPRAISMDHVTSPLQAKALANALLMEDRDSLRLEVELRPRLGPGGVLDKDNPEYVMPLVSLHPGDVVDCDLTMLNGRRNMVVESTSVDHSTTVVRLILTPQVTGHTDLFFGTPPYERPFAVRPYSELGLDPPYGTVAAAGMSLDRRFIFIGVNSGRSPTRQRPTVAAVPAQPATPEVPAETSFTYVLGHDDEQHRMQVRTSWVDTNGISRTQNGWYAGRVVQAQGVTGNTQSGTFRGQTQSGNWAVGETITVTIDRTALATNPVQLPSPDAEVTVQVLRRVPGTPASAAIIVSTHTLAATIPGQAAVPAVEGVDGFAVGPRILVFDTATRKTGVLENTARWNGSTDSGQGIGSLQGDPENTVSGTYPDRSVANTLFLPDVDDLTGAWFNATGDDVVATNWFTDRETAEHATWDFNPGLRWKNDSSRGTLGPSHNAIYDTNWVTAAWHTQNGVERFRYGQESGISDGPGGNRLPTTNISEDASSPWAGTVLFDGDYPEKDSYASIHQDDTYSYWLRTDGGVEIRDSIWLWDRSAPINHHVGLDLPAGKLRAGSSIAIRSVEPGAIITLYEFLADGSGIRRWDNRNIATGQAGEWTLRRGPLE